jgi:general secretion pathway protein D
VLIALGLNACSPGLLEERGDEAPNAADAVRSADFSPKSPSPVRSSAPAGSHFEGFSIFGSPAAPTNAAAPSSASDAGSTSAAAPGVSDTADGFTLNFENTPVSSVVKVVIGDTLGANYILDPRAQGMISLSTGRPIAKKDLLFVLESALKANNLSMTREGGSYRIGPANDGGGGPVDRGATADPGYGVSVIPLQYVSGANISRLLEGFATRPGAIRTDPSGQILIVVGSGAERQSAIETVRSFDVDWMHGQSVGLYPVRSSEPEPIVAALEKIMDSGEGGMGHGLVKFQPIAHRNAILVVSARPDLLRVAQRWIERLDSPDPNAQAVHVYKVKYGDAKQIALLLNSMFASSGGSSTADSSSNQLAPSSGDSQLSAAEKLTGGRQNTNQQNGQTSTGPVSSQGAQGSSSVFGGLQPASALASAMNAGGQGAGVLPGVRITSDQTNNSVVVYSSTENYQVIERALNQLDRPRAQVAIDVTIAEVTLNDSLNYGVQVYLHGALGSIINSTTGQGVPATSAPAGFNILVGSEATPKAIINALHAVTDVRILSNPSLVVVDNQEASLEVGDQVPVSTGSATVLTTSNTVVNTVDYKNTGIILHVLPRISPDNTVNLAIDQEISSVPNNTSTTNLTPTISERKVKSSVSVVSGQMVMLAGLIADEQDKTRSGVPGLSQLPWVGSAFGNTSKSTQRTELIVLIRPQVIRGGVDASEVAEELRAKMRAGRVPAFSLPDALNVNTRSYQ